MKILGKNRLSCLAAATLLVVAGSLSAQRSDTRAGYASLFGPTGPANMKPAMLVAGLPPVIGQLSTIGVHAQGYDFAAVVLSLNATSGQPLQIGGQQLSLYVDPISLAAIFPMPLRKGLGQVQLPIPRIPSLIGFDLAWQAVVFTKDFRKVAATNLLAANVGVSAFAGSMVFTWKFKHSAKKADDFRDVSNLPALMFCNFGPAVNVTFKGTCSRKIKAGSPIEIRTGPGRTGALIGVITRKTFNVRVTVPAGTVTAPTYVYFYNTDRRNTVSIEWSMEIG